MSTQAASKVDVIKKHFSLLCELRKQYKIEIVTDEANNDPVINYKLAEIYGLNHYLEFLRDEMAIYPAAIINKLQLDRIILCSDLKKLDKPVSGCASMSLFPDNLALRMLFRKNTIYLDTKYDNTIDGLVTIHHELYHAIESHDGSFPKYVDLDWNQLNEARFQYRSDILSFNKTPSLDFEGFLTDYSMETVREDKAELFSHLIVNHPRVEELAKKDQILAFKITRLKKLLRDFSPDFNDQFWATRRERAVKGGHKVSYEHLLLPRLR
jgi:hypothetical protein